VSNFALLLTTALVKSGKTKPKLSLYSSYYAEACNEFAVFIFAT